MSRPTQISGDVVGGRYRIARVLGQGGFGTVYEAVCLDRAESVALKILHLRLGASSTDVRRFEREAALAQQIIHPNVVRTLDFGHTAEGMPFIAFELLQGHSLRDEIARRGALAPVFVGQVATQVLDALAAAHALGVVHRDIKPGNIFLCQDQLQHHGPSSPLVKVLDFGIAKAVWGDENATQLTATGHILGTPAFMAPEQARGGEIGETADLYALGLVMAEALSGERVVHGDSDIAVLMAHVAHQPHELPRAVRGSPFGPVIERAVQKAPQHRFVSAAAMREALANVLDRLQTAETAASVAQPPAATMPSPLAPTVYSGPLPPGAPAVTHVPPPAPARPPVALLVGLVSAFGLSLGVGIAVVWWALQGTADPTAGASPVGSFDPVTAPAPVATTPPRKTAGGAGVLDRLTDDQLRGHLRALGWKIVDDQPSHGTSHLRTKSFGVHKGEEAGAVHLTRWTTEQLAEAQVEGLERESSWAVYRDGSSTLSVGMVTGNPHRLLKSLLDRLPHGRSKR